MNAKKPDDGQTPEAKADMTETQGSNDRAATEATTEKASGFSDLASQLQAVQAENAELKDKMLRVLAEMENVRRRMERDKAEATKYAITRFARDVVSVADNIRRAIDAAPAIAEGEATDTAQLKGFVEGVQMTERELLAVFERHGIKRIDPLGQAFDPNQHQAMFEAQVPNIAAGTVMQVLQAGFMLEDRVLRPALVGVARGEAKPADAPAHDSSAEGAAESELNGGEQPHTSAPGERLDKSV